MAFERQHQAVAVDHAGRRRQIGRDAGELRLEQPRFLRRQALYVVDAVLARGRGDRVELVEVLGLRGDEQLAAALVRDAGLRAEPIEHRLAGDAQPGAQAARRIIEAGVDHLGVARARLRADAVVALEHEHLLAGKRQRAGDREPDDARSDDHCLHIRRHDAPAQLPCRLIFKPEFSTGQILRRHARIIANPD